MLEQAVAPERLPMVGDSAGGGLAYATLLALPAQGLPIPACAVTMSPWVDLEGTGASAQPSGADDPMLELADLQASGRAYGGAHLRNPLALPIYGDLRGLPPLLIHLGTRELLLDDATRIAALAWRAGVDVELQVYAGLIHVWQAIPSLPGRAGSARDRRIPAASARLRKRSRPVLPRAFATT